MPDADGIIAKPAGTKHDSGKTDWTLLPWKSLEKVVEVMDYGQRKYARDNWKEFATDDARNRYAAALMRHFVAWQDGEKADPESGLLHLAHLACNAVFLLWYELRGE